MNTIRNQVVIHIDESIDVATLGEIERQLRGDDAGLSLTRHIERPHLIVSDYDTGRLRSSDVLGGFRRHGLHVQLIGM